MNKTSISWVRGPDGASGYTWNPFAGCEHKAVSAGCVNCYAARLAATRLAHLPGYVDLATIEKLAPSPTAIPTSSVAKWTGEVRFFPKKLYEPCRKRQPSGIFCGDMGDIALLTHEQIISLHRVMMDCKWHRFFVLTKRPKLLNEALGGYGGYARLPNVIFGVSVSNQEDADSFIPELLWSPVRRRFISLEPLLQPIDISRFLPSIDWVIIGGESGGSARPCHVSWIRSVLKQCRDAGVPVHVKQLGAHVECDGKDGYRLSAANADPQWWPEDLRVREPPNMDDDR